MLQPKVGNYRLSGNRFEVVPEYAYALIKLCTFVVRLSMIDGRSGYSHVWLAGANSPLPS